MLQRITRKEQAWRATKEALRRQALAGKVDQCEARIRQAELLVGRDDAGDYVHAKIAQRRMRVGQAAQHWLLPHHPAARRVEHVRDALAIDHVEDGPKCALRVFDSGAGAAAPPVVAP